MPATPTPRTRTHAALATAICLAVASAAVPAHADITTTGDVEPDPATSTSTTTLYVGNTADGTMTVNGGSAVNSQNGYLGYSVGTTGIATITGTGSTWRSTSVNIGVS